MKQLITTLLAILITQISLAQQTGEIDYPYLGIKFSVPEGWMGQETEGAFVMGHNSIPGFVLMTTHEAKSIDEMRQEAQKGIMDQNGTVMQLQDQMSEIGGVGLGGHFSGTIEWTQAEAYIIGVVNPFNQGVLIMAITDPQNYGKSYEDLAKEIAGSLTFYEPKESPAVKEWGETLKGAKLTYLDSYYSSDYSGGYGGYSSREEILLCSNGRFDFYSNSNLSVDGGGGTSAYSDSTAGGMGTWEVQSSGDGGAMLILTYNDGSSKEYNITYEDEKTMLNGYRYYRTYDHGQCY